MDVSPTTLLPILTPAFLRQFPEFQGLKQELHRRRRCCGEKAGSMTVETVDAEVFVKTAASLPEPRRAKLAAALKTGELLYYDRLHKLQRVRL